MNPCGCVYVSITQEYIVAIIEELDLPSEGEHHDRHRRHFLIELEHFELIFDSVIYSKVPPIEGAPNIHPSDPIAKYVLLASEIDCVRILCKLFLYIKSRV